MSNEKEIASNLIKQNSSDFYDADVKKIGEIMAPIVRKYSHKKEVNEKNIQEFEKEVVERMAEAGYVVRVFFDKNGLLTVEPVMRVSGSPEDKYGFDHEKKQHEVVNAVLRGEDYRGQKE
jgi:hypothetical protein